MARPSRKAKALTSVRRPDCYTDSLGLLGNRIRLLPRASNVDRLPIHDGPSRRHVTSNRVSSPWTNSYRDGTKMEAEAKNVTIYPPHHSVRCITELRRARQSHRAQAEDRSANGRSCGECRWPQRVVPALRHAPALASQLSALAWVETFSARHEAALPWLSLPAFLVVVAIKAKGSSGFTVNEVHTRGTQSSQGICARCRLTDFPRPLRAAVNQGHRKP